MHRFLYLVKFLIAAFLFQSIAYLSARDDERIGDGYVLVAAPSTLKRCASMPLFRDDSENPPPSAFAEGSSPSINVNVNVHAPLPPPFPGAIVFSAMSPTSFGKSVALNLLIDIFPALKTTKDYVDLMVGVEEKKRKSLSEILNIEGVIAMSRQKISNLQRDVGKECYGALTSNGFNWQSRIDVQGQGYLAIAVRVMGLLNASEENLARYFTARDIDNLKKELKTAIDIDQARSTEASAEEDNLRMLIKLVDWKDKGCKSGYSWNNCDF